MSHPTPDRLSQLIEVLLRSDQPEQTLVELCRAHPEHADALRACMSSEPSTVLGASGDVSEWESRDGVPRTRLGDYELIRVLGEGGMGTVYLAEQREPVRRRVALKLIKLGMDSKAIVQRFEQERQALALMDHEGIAKVYDCGTNERGQPYFVMELVNGVPLDECCEERRLSLVERLALLRQVCAAVQHAHQKGVVHRDLKPSNVLVADVDGELQVKIIDFGLAKAIGQKLIQESFFTELGLVVGTPEYMAPEQADPDNLDVDTRADVYSLGVLLFELLVGDLPFDGQALRKAGLIGLQRMLQEMEPPRPSVRLQSSGELTAAQANKLRVTPGALRRALKGDLDWVVIKALEKDRNRRYDSANALAEDLRRFVDHEPLQAGPPSVLYRLQKLLRRHRAPVTAAAMVLLALIGGGVATYVQWQRAEQQASDNLELAEANEKIAKEKTALAASERQAKDEAQTNAQRFRAKSAEFEAKVKEFDQLATVVRYDNALLGAERLLQTRALPQAAVQMEAWLADVDALLAMRPEIGATVASLREDALPWTEARRAAFEQNDPEAYAQWEQNGQVLRTLQYAQAIRSGDEPLPERSLSAEQRALDPEALNKMAWERVTTKIDERTVWGEEALGLAAARLAVKKAVDGEQRPTYLHTLAWAWLANGRDREAIEASEQAQRAAPPGSYESYHVAVIDAVEHAPQHLARATERYPARPVWEYAAKDDALAFLHRTLVELLGKLDGLEREQRTLIAGKLAWSRRIVDLTRAHPNANVTWNAVRESLRSSQRYADCEIPLAEADIATRWLGLVPLGTNPVTGLLEFYHLRSACDGDVDTAATLEIPSHDSDGSIDIGIDKGIVFVLLPGGRVTMGSQRDDVDGEMYDPDSQNLIEAVFTVELSPFLLARHEVTQGQWARLWNGPEEGRRPSQYAAGNNVAGTFMTMAHPVEQVSADTCSNLLRGHGLILPTEAQWEYGCRAGTGTPWIVSEEQLFRYANVSDRTAQNAGANWSCESWTDGHIVHAPVGSFLPNAFGLYDVHGNVWEWCRDRYAACGTERPGDGLRRDAGAAKGVYRGGCFNELAVSARSACRLDLLPNMRYSHLGLRAARSID